MTSSIAELTIDREAAQGATAREARCIGAWTVPGFAERLATKRRPNDFSKAAEDAMYRRVHESNLNEIRRSA